jgi:hypothetical protein
MPLNIKDPVTRRSLEVDHRTRRRAFDTLCLSTACATQTSAQ